LKGNIQEEKPEEKDCGYILIEIIQNELFESTLSNLLEYSKDKNLISDIHGTIVILFMLKYYGIKIKI
jgi:hypothetical protein